MAFQSAPGVLEAVVHGRIADAQTWVNVFHFPENGLQADQTTADTLATYFDSAYTTLAPWMSTDWHVDSVELYGLTTQGSPSYSSAITVVGTGSGAPLPNQVALVCSWRTDLRGRSYRGRTFLCGWTEVASNGNGPASGALDAVDDWATIILPGGVGVLSRRQNNLPRAVGILTDITSYRIDTVWDTMRSRRLPGN